MKHSPKAKQICVDEVRSELRIRYSARMLFITSLLGLLPSITRSSESGLDESIETTISQTSEDIYASILRGDAEFQVGSIRVDNRNIFDPDNVEEQRWFHHWANALHIRTRPTVIESQLLFAPGDTITWQSIEETERLLRANRYLAEATIQPNSINDDRVDLVVRTVDVWTLAPRVSFGRSGGTNSGGIGIKEHNVLGTGIGIGIGYKSDVDRKRTNFEYLDRNLFGSRIELDSTYTDASDGFGADFRLEKPFFSLNTRRAFGANYSSGEEIVSLYDLGEVKSTLQHRYERVEIYQGWSDGLRGEFTRRIIAGFGSMDREVAPFQSELNSLDIDSENSKYLYPFVGLQFVQDDFVKENNFDQINRTEDRHMGMRTDLRLGYASSSVGSTADAWLIEGGVEATLMRSKHSSLRIDAAIGGRIENGAGKNVRFSIAGRYDHRQSEKRLLHASLNATAGKNLDLNDPLYLGGDNGLRGYPLRYQGGDKSLLVTLEQRFYSDWYPFRLFNVGAVVFFDAGRTWGEGPIPVTDQGWLRDIGVGLRIGNTRSSIGKVLHVDLAYPLDGDGDINNLQIVVEAKKGF